MMSNINLSITVIIPCLISVLALGLIFIYRRKLFSKRKWLWVGITVFFAAYLFIVATAEYRSIYLGQALQEFDLNGDGFFNGAEVTPQQQKALKRYTSDTGRNFAFLTGLLLSGIVAVVVLTSGKIFDYLRVRKLERANSEV